MKDRHKQILSDSLLLKSIHDRVEQELTIDPVKTSQLITLKFVFYLCISVICYSGIFMIQQPILFIGCFILYGFSSMLFAFNFAHDFSHNTVFKNKRANNFCYTVLYTLMGAHAKAWKQRHIQSHHFAPNVEEYDSDLKISKLIRVIPNSKYYWWHKFQHIYATLAYTTYSLFWVFIKDVVILFSHDNYTTKKNFYYHLTFWFQKLVYIGYLFILPFEFSNQTWSVVLIGFIAMHLCQSVFLLFTFFITHHVEGTEYPTTNNEGEINTSWVMNQIKSSNDLHPFSKTANFIFGGFNNHIAHHLFPNVHHVHYPELNKVVYRVLNENGIQPNETSYFGGIVSHLRLLKKMSSVENPQLISL